MTPSPSSYRKYVEKTASFPFAVSISRKNENKSLYKMDDDDDALSTFAFHNRPTEDVRKSRKGATFMEDEYNDEVVGGTTTPYDGFKKAEVEECKGANEGAFNNFITNKQFHNRTSQRSPPSSNGAFALLNFSTKTLSLFFSASLMPSMAQTSSRWIALIKKDGK
jgi:hypothetical protein